jgi:hypothetical protein
MLGTLRAPSGFSADATAAVVCQDTDARAVGTKGTIGVEGDDIGGVRTLVCEEGLLVRGRRILG